MKKAVKYGLPGLLVVFLLIQFIRPQRVEQGTMDTHLFTVEQVPDEVANILQSACFDCHSDNVKYPWYSNVAPVSWMLANHIEEGRDHLNFSKWGDYDAKRRAHKLEEIAEEVQEGEMPMKGYVLLHSEAKLSAAQVDLLVNWANAGKSATKSQADDSKNDDHDDDDKE